MIWISLGALAALFFCGISVGIGLSAYIYMKHKSSQRK